jgi:hypothetical protein
MKRLDMPEIARSASRPGRKGRGRKSVDVPMSGRFGDRVYYMRGKKQCCRRYVVPRDPRTPAQLRWRAALSAASKAWSDNREITEAQRRACRVAGAKERSRRRLGLSGPLTGQLYYVKSTCGQGEQGAKKQECRTAEHEAGAGQARRPKREVRSANRRCFAEGLRWRGRRRGARSTWDEYRIATVLLPSQYRPGTVGGRPKAGCGAQNGRRWAGHWRELWHGS